ncbi:glycosyltransferase family 2 protein [Companilactobacillus mishanensis]|uniref:Glycosyltransferase n=1 Tax=Companilactobacillus mishanensis TaxID=2486008 RepID=A0A5P0ZHR5_9LACO|nr:glycosyltransferase family 2 protein [Companilactobacillus mishanensis]MQS52542.1 glycosyltransferase [Companilactobacillus mishanensis]
MLNKKLSIIISAYNVESYISKTIESLAGQTNTNFNVIAVDDCSTDNTLKVLRDFEDRYDWLTVVCHAQNAGVSAARNTGIQSADGDLITFIDGDDWVEPNYVDFFLKKYEKYPELDLVTCGYYVDTPNGKSKAKSDKQHHEFADRDEAIKQIIKMNGSVMGYTWNKVYRRDIIVDNKLNFLTDLDLMEDQVFNVEYATVADGFYLDDLPLYHYVSRKKSITHKFDIDNVLNVGLATMRTYKTIHQNSKDEREEI